MDYWKLLKTLAGNFENDTDLTVKFYQDEATRNYLIEVGDESHYGSSFEEALLKFFNG